MKQSCCCAIGCTNRHSKGFSMKGFPKDPWRRKIWIEKINRKNWTPTKHTYLCEIHFSPEMWENNRMDGKKTLKRSAIPTIFPGVPSEKAQKSSSKLDKASVFTKEPDTLKVDGVPNEGSSFVESKEAITSVSVPLEFTAAEENVINNVMIKQEENAAEEIVINNVMIKQEENAAEENVINNVMIKQEENGIDSINQIHSVTIKEEPIVSSAEENVNITIKEEENGVKECYVWIHEEPLCPLKNGVEECYLCTSEEPQYQLQLDPLNNSMIVRPKLELTAKERKLRMREQNKICQRIKRKQDKEKKKIIMKQKNYVINITSPISKQISGRC